MVFDVTGLYGGKGSNSNMKSDRCGAYPVLLKRLKQSMGKMETRGRCGNRSISLCKNSLITLPVQWFIPTLDVRGQRDVADLLKDIHHLTLIEEADLSFSILHLFNFSLKFLFK